MGDGFIPNLNNFVNLQFREIVTKSSQNLQNASYKFHTICVLRNLPEFVKLLVSENLFN